ncbi:MAG: 50S ribosomal protein L29 [Candidatus Omnitrophica bacterium]|nr:50S ribosomal protein L29 [Candidatus Omnitrophota bacterium]
MKTSELRNLNRDDLTQKLNTFSDEILKLNYQKRIGGLDKPHKFRSIRKDIARIKTILREQELKQKT